MRFCALYKAVFGVGRFKPTSIIWAIAYVFSFSGLAIYIRNIYVKWNIDPDIGVTERFVSTNDLPAPAVTICSPIAARPGLANSTAYFLHYADMNKTSESDRINISVSERNYLAAIVQVCGIFFSDYALARDMRGRSERDVVKLLFESSIDTKDTFNHCALRQKKFKCEEKLVRTLSDEGVCYSYNMLDFKEIFNENIISEDFRVYSTGERAFWSLAGGYTINAETTPQRAIPENVVKLLASISELDTYDLCKGRREGFRVTYHLPSEMPTVFHRSDFIAMNQKAIVHITPRPHRMETALEKYSVDKRRCFYDGERKLQFFRVYTKAHCNIECLANFTLRECGCVKFSMPRTRETRVCDVDEMECYKAASTKWPKHDPHANGSVMPCDCYPPCRSIDYDLNARFYVLSTKNSLTARKFAEREPNHTRLFLQLHMEFSDFQVIEIESYGVYKLHHFIADCGGLFGLFMGISFLSIVGKVIKVIEFCLESKKNEREEDTEKVFWAERKQPRKLNNSSSDNLCLYLVPMRNGIKETPPSPLKVENFE